MTTRKRLFWNWWKFKVTKYIAKFDKWLDAIDDEIKKRIGEIVEDVTELTCDEAKKKVPVAKKNGGTLKNSINTMYTTDGLTGYVYTNIHYSTYQEFGFVHYKSKKKVAGFWYMGEAYDKYYDKFIEDLKKLM